MCGGCCDALPASEMGHSRRYCHVRALVRYPQQRTLPRPVETCLLAAFLRPFCVEVDAKEVRIMGSKSVLLRTLVAASSAKTADFGVTSFVPKWRALRESNPCFRRERAASWTARRRARASGAPRHIERFARSGKQGG